VDPGLGYSGKPEGVLGTIELKLDACLRAIPCLSETGVSRIPQAGGRPRRLPLRGSAAAGVSRAPNGVTSGKPEVCGVSKER